MTESRSTRQKPLFDKVATSEAEDRAEPASAPYAPPDGFVARTQDLVARLMDRIKEHNLPVISAGIAFWGLLAIPATLASTLSIYGMVADPDQVEDQINDSLSSLPESAREIISDQLESVAGSSGAGLAIGAAVGVILALWTVSGAVAKVIATLNTIWRVREDRKFPVIRGVALAITFGAIVFFALAAFVLAVLPAILSEVGLGGPARWLLNLARVPALLLFMAAGLGILYWAGPNRRSRFRAASPGAITGTILWLVLSFAFSVYTTYFSSYNETYGVLGGVVILLLWLYMTSFVVLLGAEVDSALEDRAAGLAPPSQHKKA
jgi:membrane protein